MKTDNLTNLSSGCFIYMCAFSTNVSSYRIRGSFIYISKTDLGDHIYNYNINYSNWFDNYIKPYSTTGYLQFPQIFDITVSTSGDNVNFKFVSYLRVQNKYTWWLQTTDAEYSPTFQGTEGVSFEGTKVGSV